ncbi:hypothetical protein PFISCL1PPCAC_15276, partial [Pristionchus fissidentatus]
MQYLPFFLLFSLTSSRPDFDAAIPFFELDDAKISGSYRHRANRPQKAASTVATTTRAPPVFG